MLRAKQISSLSQSARSFIFSGSRCNAADGSSCTCTEDETSFPKKQHTSSEVTLPQKTPTLLSKTKAKAETVISGDSVKVVEYQKAESVSYSASVQQILSIPRCSLTSDCENDVHAVQKDPVHKSSFVADHFFKAGIAAVSFLSDLANSRIPVLDGSLLLPSNCMVDSTRPISGIKSTNVKLHKKENFSKVHGKPSAEIAGGSNSTNHYRGPKGKDERVGSVKVSNQFPGIVTGNASQTQSIPSEYCDVKRFIPQRAKTDPYSVSKSKSYGQASETKVVGGIAKGYGSMDGIQNLARNTKMQTGAAPLARQSLNARNVVERAFNILQRLKWGPAAEEALVNLNFLLDAYQANQILKHLQDHSAALGFFYWLKHQARFKHDEHTYTTMVGILGRARQFGAINKLLDEMVRDGCMPNVVTYNRLIHSYGRANYMNAAVNVFYQMQKAGCKPDRVTYCTLIDIHAKAGYLDVAMDMYQRMQAAGLSPDTFTYSVIINCLGKAGHLNAAYKLFCEMVDQGCVPNLVTYNIMIAMQAKARNYPCALKLYRDMQAAGFEPDNVTYSIVMEVLGHCGHLEEAEVVFDEMKRKDWIPDEPVYGLLVDLWGKAGNVDKAQAWYQAMLNADLCPNVPTCNSLLSAFLRSHRFSDAYNLVQSMLRLGLHPSLQTYTLLLSCCTETQSACDMGFCCELMAITGHPAHAFLLSMPASGPDGQNVRDHASDFLDLMHSEDRESKRGLVDAVVDFLHKSGLKEEAGSVWEVAAQRNVYPDAVREKGSSYWLINLHVMSDGTAVTALSRTLAWFRKQLLASGIGPNRIDIVTGWGRRSRVTGSSLVRQSVQDLLHIFSFPFSTGNGNSGCFVGCGEPLNRWLLHSYVERMHLL